jgi:hypothetical protein
MWNATSLALFLGGFAAGVAACWIYIAYMKQTVKLYETYIRQRIDGKWQDGLNNKESAPTTANNPTASTQTVHSSGFLSARRNLCGQPDPSARRTASKA